MLKTKKLSDAALEVLSRVKCEKRIAWLPMGRLDRALYVEVNAALEALGGKWTRRVQGHVFDFDPAEAIDAIVSAGCWTDVKKSLDQFYTPPELARQIVHEADVFGFDVLEPSAGRGALAHECLRQGATHVCTVEIDEAASALLSGDCTKTRADFMALDPFGPGLPLGGRSFPRIVMNPPFSRGQDVAHVERAYSHWLSPGGRLVAIMGAGVTFRDTGAHRLFRALVASHGRMYELPDGSFKESGTNVRAVVVTLNAPAGATADAGVG